MTTNIRPFRRRLRLTRGKLGKMAQERQKLSFFLVIIFLVIFGLIILAEVLFMEEGKGNDFFYEDNTYNKDTDSGGWETPKPLLPAASQREALGSYGNDMSISSSSSSSDKDKVRSERLQLSLKRHQEEMERLIKNISARINRKPSTTPSPRPYAYLNEPNLQFDFALKHHTGYDARWQPVNGTSHKFYVYSAYYDARMPQRPVVRVIGATKTKMSDKVWCKMYFSDDANEEDEEPPVVVVPGGITVIRENWNLKYSASFVLCTLPQKLPGSKSSVRVPESVSIVSGASAEASNQLPVLNHKKGTGTDEVKSTDIGVCVKPLHFNYNKTLELIEFVELNKILGVTKFTLYNDTVSPDVSCVLEHYMAEGSVAVLPWKLNIDSQTEIRTEGLFAALNDCLYRNMNDFRYLMLTDFDELVVPHLNDTIPEMLQHLDAQKIVLTGNGGGYGRKVPPHPKVTSSYSFQNAFFYLQFPDDDESKNGPALRVLRKTRRKSKFNPQKQRSKYICIPRNVKEAGNHFIWEFARGSNLNVPTSHGFLHHYRVCEFGGDDCVHTDSQVDRTVYRYRDLLVKNVDKIVQKLSDRCQLDKLQQELSPRSTSSESATTGSRTKTTTKTA